LCARSNAFEINLLTKNPFGIKNPNIKWKIERKKKTFLVELIKILKVHSSTRLFISS
jgi:hypothetical protein